ncbi:MAG: DUF4199 domain-containing protein [Cyclobacteriaceae bacterium]|nr:DUF4199 domain-containing protein [Cyclobacteriaceae bacterium]
MKRIILVYGLIAGAITGGMLMISMPLHEKGILNMDSGMVLGYTTMVIALSLVFVGVKNYRDNHRSGSISFLTGLKIGLLITLVASVLYALSWEIAYNTIAGDFMQQMNEKSIEKMKLKGVPEVELQAARIEMEEFNALYRNPLIRFVMTLMEILPVGLLISLVSASLLRNPKFLPAHSPAP